MCNCIVVENIDLFKLDCLKLRMIVTLSYTFYKSAYLQRNLSIIISCKCVSFYCKISYCVSFLGDIFKNIIMEFIFQNYSLDKDCKSI